MRVHIGQKAETEGNNNSKVTKSNTNNKTKTNKKIVGYDWPIGVRYMKYLNGGYTQGEDAS